MKIMKRRNKSVEKARERPETIIGGKMQFASKYIKNKKGTRRTPKISWYRATGRAEKKQ